MKYNFDKIIDRRGSNSEKWDALETLFGSADLLSMWVADMDFPCGDFITDALQERIKHHFYGYTFPGESLLEAVIEKAERDYGWKIQKEWILFSNGVVDGAYNAIKAVTNGIENPGIIIQPPVYYPFFNIIKKNAAVLWKTRSSIRTGNTASILNIRKPALRKTP